MIHFKINPNTPVMLITALYANEYSRYCWNTYIYFIIYPWYLHFKCVFNQWSFGDRYAPTMLALYTSYMVCSCCLTKYIYIWYSEAKGNINVCLRSCSLDWNLFSTAIYLVAHYLPVLNVLSIISFKLLLVISK